MRPTPSRQAKILLAKIEQRLAPALRLHPLSTKATVFLSARSGLATGACGGMIGRADHVAMVYAWEFSASAVPRVCDACWHWQMKCARSRTIATAGKKATMVVRQEWRRVARIKEGATGAIGGQRRSLYLSVPPVIGARPWGR